MLNGHITVTNFQISTSIVYGPRQSILTHLETYISCNFKTILNFWALEGPTSLVLKAFLECFSSTL